MCSSGKHHRSDSALKVLLTFLLRMAALAGDRIHGVLLFLAVAVAGNGAVCGQLHPDEECRVQWRHPTQIVTHVRPPGPIPVTAAAPVTVASAEAPENERLISLDEAIRLALRNAKVVRVFTGTSAASSGRTIYDPAIAVTSIDQSVSRFDPVFSANSSFRRTERPFGIVDPADPLRALIRGEGSGGHDFSTSLSKTNRLGGTAQAAVIDIFNRNRGPDILDPTHRPSLEVSYTQPLLAGAGRDANEAAILLARIDSERSYFQFKDGIQELVSGVINAYWTLVSARTSLWAREKQVEQLTEALEREEARFRAELADIGDISQTRVALADFEARLIAARAAVLQQEAAFRNLLGLPPEDGLRFVPSSPPTREQIMFQWEELVRSAQFNRPDLIELNLILQADQQRLIQSQNTAKPTLNAVSLYRWNGLTGRMRDGSTISSGLDESTDWTLGVNFSVPVGLRQARASLRSTELLIARDRANLDQGLHQVEHNLATTIRLLDQLYLQYRAFQRTREAAEKNLALQFAQKRQGRVIFLVVLQAITDWGNAVAAEADTLTQYNATLGTLERQTGTILDTHGIRFTEERFASIGPWGPCFDQCRPYPKSLPPSDNRSRYAESDRPAEKVFRLDEYEDLQKRPSPPRSEESRPPVPIDPASANESKAFPEESASGIEAIFQPLDPKDAFRQSAK